MSAAFIMIIANDILLWVTLAILWYLSFVAVKRIEIDIKGLDIDIKVVAQKQIDTTVILDALADVRAEVNNHISHTLLEHTAFARQLDKVNSRLQFLMATKIAEELVTQKAFEVQKALAETQKATDYEAGENGSITLPRT